MNLLLIIQSDPGYRLPHPGMGPSLRLGATRTYVRNGSTSQVYQAGAGAGYCRVALMGRNSPAPWVQAGRGKPEDGSEVCGPLASQHRPLRSICVPAGPSPPCSNTARSDPGEEIQLSPGPPQTSSVRRGDQETNLRALRSGRDLARRGDFHDPRPRQRNSRRQPPRESQNRLSELRCDAVNPLRPEEPQSATRTFLPSLWEGLQAGDHRHLYCSRACGTRWNRRGKPRPSARRAIRPPREVLLQEIEKLGYSAVGRRYGVSDNAIRKWMRAYERERAAAEGLDPDVVEIPRSTWPNRRRNKAA